MPQAFRLRHLKQVLDLEPQPKSQICHLLIGFIFCQVNHTDYSIARIPGIP